MKIVLSSPEVVPLIKQRGGRIYVRTDPHRCCSGSLTYLVTETSPARDREYVKIDADGFELFLSSGHMDPPSELHLDVKGWRTKHVEAYWNGCAFAV